MERARSERRRCAQRAMGAERFSKRLEKCASMFRAIAAAEPANCGRLAKRAGAKVACGITRRLTCAFPRVWQTAGAWGGQAKARRERWALLRVVFILKVK